MFSVRKIGSFILAFVLLIIGSILEGIVPKEIGRGIDSIQSGVSVNSTFSGILLLILMAFICSRIGLIGIKLLTVSAVGALRTYLYSFWNYKNYKKIDGIKKGEFTQIINDDLQNISHGHWICNCSDKYLPNFSNIIFDLIHIVFNIFLTI